MPNFMLHIPRETCQPRTYSFMQGLYLLVWLPSLGSALAGSLAPDTPGLIPHTSGSAPPTSLNKALQTTSDFMAQCPTPWEMGCVWAHSSLGTARSGWTELAQFKPCSELGTSLRHWAVAGRWPPEFPEEKPCGACRQPERGGKGKLVSAPWGSESSS